MKKYFLLALVAALPVFGQEAAPAPQADAKAAFIAKYDADKDGKVCGKEALAAKHDFMKANRDKFAGKKHGKHEGRRPHGPKMNGKFAPKAGFNKQGRRPMPQMNGKFAPKAPKHGFNKQGRRPMPQMGGQFGPKAPKAGKFAPKAPKMNGGCRCGKKHAPGVQPKGMPVQIRRAA